MGAAAIGIFRFITSSEECESLLYGALSSSTSSSCEEISSIMSERIKTLYISCLFKEGIQDCGRKSLPFFFFQDSQGISIEMYHQEVSILLIHTFKEDYGCFQDGNFLLRLTFPIRFDVYVMLCLCYVMQTKDEHTLFMSFVRRISYSLSNIAIKECGKPVGFQKVTGIKVIC